MRRTPPTNADALALAGFQREDGPLCERTGLPTVACEHYDGRVAHLTTAEHIARAWPLFRVTRDERGHWWRLPLSRADDWEACAPVEEEE